MRKPDGYLIGFGPAKQEEFDMVQCAHCMAHFKVKRRNPEGGWCAQCSHFICLPCTDKGTCTPFMKQIEQEEKEQYRKNQNARILGI